MINYHTINYTIKYKTGVIYVPSIAISIFEGELITCLKEYKHEINEILSKHEHNNTCVLCQIPINFDCYFCCDCDKCIFKPGIIKRIGIGTFKKLLMLSINENYWKYKSEKVYKLIKK